LRKKELFTENVEEFSEESIYNFIEELEIQKNYKKVIEPISKMDEIYSITLMYVFIEEKSVKEIASLMGISQRTVYTRLERGRKILLSSLKGVIYD
jgi:DNA-directed RNA polymerase specialized sigma24 family protein